MKKVFITSLMILLTLTSKNIMAIDFNECKDQLEYIERRSENAANYANQLIKISDSIKLFNTNLNGCRQNSNNCEYFKASLSVAASEYNSTLKQLNSYLDGLVIAFSAMQSDCDYNLKLINMFNNRNDDMECSGLLLRSGAMGLRDTDKKVLYDACFNKYKNEEFCKKCFSVK